MEFSSAAPVKKHIVMLDKKLPICCKVPWLFPSCWRWLANFSLLFFGAESFPKPPMWSMVRAWKSCCSAEEWLRHLSFQHQHQGQDQGQGQSQGKVSGSILAAPATVPLCWLDVWLWSWCLVLGCYAWKTR